MQNFESYHRTPVYEYKPNVTLSKPPSSNLGLYMQPGDDGHGALWNTSCAEVDWVRKDVVEVFGKFGLRITIQTNLKVADFLDVTFN